jgi:hypothetical protein
VLSSVRSGHRRWTRPHAPAAPLGVGFIAMGLLLAAELGVPVLLRGLLPVEGFTDRDLGSGAAYYGSLLLVGLLP